MNSFLEWLDENKKGVAIGLAIILAVGGLIWLLVALYEPPLKQGVVINKVSTPDVIRYFQYEQDKYRTEYTTTLGRLRMFIRPMTRASE